MQTARKPSFQPTLECLEERNLMAAHLTASLSSGLLRIDGTNGADTIVVREIHNQISVDGTTISVAGHGRQARVSAASVARIEVFGYGGNDRIFLNSEAVRGQQALTKPVTVWGGDGNDLIVAGAGPETIYGGAGNDTLYGGRGNDVLDGGTGTNRMVGGTGNDTFFSHSHTDVISRGRHHNTIYRSYSAPTRAASIHGLEYFAPPPTTSSAFAAQVNQILALENAYRESHGLGRLTVSAALTTAAQNQANDMARTGDYDHVNSAGAGLPQRVAAVGYSYSWVGENIHRYDPSSGRNPGSGRQYTTSELASYFFDGWRGSPEHNANLLSPHAVQIGVALAQAANGQIYAVMDLGHP